MAYSRAFAVTLLLAACHKDHDICNDANCTTALDMTAVSHDMTGTSPQDAMTSIDQGPLCTPNTEFCSDALTISMCAADGESATVVQSCTYGCGSSPTVHCKTFVPSFPVLSSDATTGLADVTLPSGVVTINTDTGAISGGVRAANSDPTVTATVSGITYRQIAPSGGTDLGTGIFSVNSLTVPAGTTLYVIGTRSVALVAETSMTINGVIDARAYDTTSGNVCFVAGAAGPGGYSGATTASSVGNGPGYGGAGSMGAGGGGAGHGGAGGAGGGSLGLGGAASAGGTIDYNHPITPIHGGSGGGSGSLAGVGGGGGGAVQLFANGTISIGGDTSASGGIDVGGCAGSGGAAGGGGGSGGTILIEAPTVNLLAHAVLAANGGGGAGATAGTNAGLDNTRPSGTASSTTNAAGGDGAAGASAAGGSGSTGQATQNGGGGGGACGIIVVSALAGAPMVTSGAVVSPSEGTMNSTNEVVTLYSGLITE